MACEASAIAVLVLSESCASLVSGVVPKLLEIVALRLWEIFVRGFFDGLSDSSALMALFLDLEVWIIVFWTYLRCACVSATIRLRSAISAIFCARVASRVAFRSAFSRASCSRAACRMRIRRFLFSLVSRAFSSLAIAAWSFLSFVIYLRWRSAFSTSAKRCRTRATLFKLKKSICPSFSSRSYRFIVFPRFRFFFLCMTAYRNL
jgi:hypothetical protein